MSLYSDPYGDQDKAASDQQVKGVYQPQTQKDPLSYKDIDEGHGGINVTVQQADGAASSTSASVHNSSCPTAAELGIN